MENRRKENPSTVTAALRRWLACLSFLCALFFLPQIAFADDDVSQLNDTDAVSVVNSDDEDTKTDSADAAATVNSEEDDAKNDLTDVAATVNSEEDAVQNTSDQVLALGSTVDSGENAEKNPDEDDEDDKDVQASADAIVGAAVSDAASGTDAVLTDDADTDDAGTDDADTEETETPVFLLLRSANVSEPEEEAYPSSFDLRDRGVVTPVKSQDPWGTCWSFGAISAAEISILSEMGATYAETGLDLSERYLTWYVTNLVPESVSASQAGEGLNLYTTDAGPNHIFTFGGREKCAATLFAQGIGPVAEADYPYRGAEGRLALDDLLTNKESYIEQKIAALRDNYDSYWYDDDYFLRVAEASYEAYLARYQAYDAYSPLDDWGIYDADEPGSGRLLGSQYTLMDNTNITYWVHRSDSSLQDNELYGKDPIFELGEYALYQDSIDQVKAELLAGRGVSVGINLSNNALNPDTWAVYNKHFLNDDAPHVVCIVGWDDNYDASNFTHTKTLTGSQVVGFGKEELTDEQAIALTTPPMNGAWIVKNSWGSETDAIKDGLVAPDGTTRDANSGAWGIVDENGLHTGYFYLSYYDSRIVVPETFTFELRENHDQENALQLDYMPASAAEWRNENTSEMWEANVFTLTQDMRIDEVATRIKMTDLAPITGFDVTFSIYKLNEGAVTPDDGELLAICNRRFESEGYHRTALDAPLYLKEGDSIGIVVQQSHTFDDGTTKYCVSAQETTSYLRYHRDPVYGTVVVNEGESFWKCMGVTDQEEASINGWLDVTAPMSSELNQYLNPQTWEMYEWFGAVGTPIYDFFEMDNFCIKAFGEPVSLTPVAAVSPTCEDAGNTAYWLDPLNGAIFENEAGTIPLTVEEVTLSPLGHDWGEPTYTWAEDNASVTARSICRRDNTHILEETVNTTVDDRTEEGTVIWAAAFENETFATQTRSADKAVPAYAPEGRAGSAAHPDPVPTGDEADPILWNTLLVAALAYFAVFLIMDYKRRHAAA